MKNIRPYRYGFRVYKFVNGKQVEKKFKRHATTKQMLAWVDETAVSLRHRLPDTPESGSLQADVDRYLLQVRAMPTYAQRQQHLDLWIAALGAARPRAKITAADLRAVLQGWRLEHAAATCNKRRSAMMHLWSVLDGKGASNPVRDVPKFRPDEALPRGRDPHLIDAKLKAAPICRSRACCRVLLWTGLRPVELQRAQPVDLNVYGKTLIVRTAKGGRFRVVPLTSQAVQAWKEFIKVKCWQRVPQAAPLNRWLKKVTGLEMRVYDLRHTYGTALAGRQTRLDVIGAMMGHSTLELTKRYTLAAVTPDALTATRALGRKRNSGRDSGSRRK